MGQQGIYCGPVETSPNRDRESCPIEESPMRMWVMEFNIYGIGKGCSVVKANNAKMAEQTLKSQGMYNGTPKMYEVTRIEEIIEPPCNGLMCEQIVEIQRE